MSAASLCLRERWRTAGRAWLALAVLLAVGGGFVIAVTAGASRAGSAFPRFLTVERAPDGYVFLTGPQESLVGRIETLPEVLTAAHGVGLANTTPDFTPVILDDARFGTTISKFKVLSGRMPSRADEASVSFTLASARHLHPGSTLDLEAPTSSGSDPVGVRPVVAAIHVVGVIAQAREFPPLSYGSLQSVYLTPAFLATPAGRAWEFAPGRTTMVAVRLRAGPDQFHQFIGDVDRLVGGPVGSVSQASSTASVERSMHLQVLALRLLAAFAGLVLVTVLSQLVIRQFSEEKPVQVTLRALGMTSADIAVKDLVWMVTAGLVAAAGSVLVAWLASPLFPLGSARQAEPHPGMVFDAPVILSGAAAVVLLTAALGASSSWYVGRRRAAVTGPPPGPSHRIRLGFPRLPVVAATGVRLAVETGRGAGGVPVRTTIGATAVGVAAVVVAMIFGASLTHLLSTPRLYGTSFQADVSVNGVSFSDIRPYVPGIRDDPDVSDVAVASVGIPLRSGRVTFGAEVLTGVKGSILPTLEEGRLPEAPGEIVLGSVTMSALHTTIGRTVDVGVEGLTGSERMRVVGRGVLSTVNEAESLGRGAVLNAGAIPMLLAHAPAGFTAPPPGDALVRFRDGLPPDRGVPALLRKLGGPEKVVVNLPAQPTDVADFGQVRNLPDALAGLLAVLAVATLAYLLVTGIRRRRRELAVLKALGFVPNQVSGAIAWQATTVVVLAMIVGLPIGIVAGRAAWSAVAGQIGVLVETTVPWGLVAALVPAGVLVANLVAAAPAAYAGRVSPSQSLRSE